MRSWIQPLHTIIGILLMVQIACSEGCSSTQGCLQLSSARMPYWGASRHCEEHYGVLLTVTHFAEESSKYQCLLKESNNVTVQVWIDNKTVTGASMKGRECLLWKLGKEVETVKSNCDDPEYFFCYNSATICTDEPDDNVSSSAVNLSTTGYLFSNDSSRETQHIPKEKKTVIIIICVYLTSAALIVIGGIVIVKIKYRKSKASEPPNEDELYYGNPFYSPMPLSSRASLTPLYGVTQHGGYRLQRQLTMSPRIRNLSEVHELGESSEEIELQSQSQSQTTSQTPPQPQPQPLSQSHLQPPSQCHSLSLPHPQPRSPSRSKTRSLSPARVTSHKNEHFELPERSCPPACRPPPGLYTPLLNPQNDTRLLSEHTDRTLQELVENPVYEPFGATSRL